MTSSSRTRSDTAAVLRLHSLGDVVLCQPTASMLSSSGRVVFLTRCGYEPLVERFGPGIEAAGIPGRGTVTALRRTISEVDPARIVDLQGSATTLLGTLPRGVDRFRTDRRLRRRVLDGDARMPLRYLSYALAAGFGTAAPPSLERRALPPEDFSVGLVCGGRWRLKTLPEQVLAELARLFIDLGHAVVTLIGGAEDAAAIRRVEVSCRRPGLRRYAGTGGVAGLLDTLERQNLVISPDSGPAHASKALGVRTLVVFTSTSPDLGFWSGEDAFGPLAGCSPCHRHGGRRCAAGTDECRDALLPLDIYRAATRGAGLR